MEGHEFHERLLHLIERQNDIMATLDEDVQAATTALTALTTGYQQLQTENAALTAQVATLTTELANAPVVAPADVTALETATAAADTALHPVVPITVTTADVTGTVGNPVTGAEAIAGGTAPYTVAATGLPDGVTVDNSGNVSGTPTAAGTSTVTLDVTDSATPPGTASATFTVTVS